MAIGRLNVRVGKKGMGKAHAQYILRQDKYKPRAQKLEKLENIGHGNMPSWAKDNPLLFWQMADEHERKNGSVYREHIIALPREMDEQQRLALAKDWIEKELGDKHAYSFAIHVPLAMDGKEQPHIHLMFSDRANDGIERGADEYFKRYNSKNPEKGGAKKLNTGLDYKTRKDQLKEQRMRWQDVCNAHLEKAGINKRIDMRNWKERGLTQQPRNIPMWAIQQDDVKKAYKEKLQARENLRQAKFEIIVKVGNLATAIDEIKSPVFAPKTGEIQRQRPSPIDTTTPTPKEPQTHDRGQNERPEKVLSFREKMAMKKQQEQPTHQPKQKPVEPQTNNDKVSTFRQKMAMQQAEKQQAEHNKRLAQLENERVEREQAERARQLAEQERLTKAQQQKDEPKRERDNSPRPF